MKTSVPTNTLENYDFVESLSFEIFAESIMIREKNNDDENLLSAK